MPWMSRNDIALADNLANDYPLTDGRDLRAMARRHMLSVQPGIFDVDDSIKQDPRYIVGFEGANRDMSGSALKTYVSEPGMPFPGILSVDPRSDAFRYDYAVAASKEFKPAIDDDGFAGPNAVVGDFSALLTATGVKMSRANAPMIDRREMLEALGYNVTGWANPRHERIARALHRAMFGRRQEADMRFAVDATTMMPSGYVGPGSQVQKQTAFRRNLQNAEKILQWVANDDVESLYKEAGFCFGAVTGERQQAEGVADLLGGDLTPKERRVSDPAYALSSGKKGTRAPADKLYITRDIFGLKYSVGSRVRTVYALCGEINAFMTAYFTGCRANYFKEFGYTWHHTTAEQIYEGLKEFAQVIGLDVTLMDQHMPPQFLRAHATWLCDYGDERFGKLVSWVNGVPYFCPQTAAGEKPYWAGNPMDPRTFTIDVGLSSGRADNPDLGKWYMTTVYFCLIDDYLKNLLEQGPNDLESIMAALKGRHPVFGLKDMGDDAILGIKPGYDLFAAKIRKDLKAAGESKRAGLSPYAMLDLETGIAFLGNVVLRDSAGQVEVPKPNPITFARNRHCPETSVNGRNTQYWGHGQAAALEHYSRAGSIIGDLERMETELWRHHFPGVPTPTQLAKKARDARPLPKGDVASENDITVLLKKDTLYYRFDDGDVSPQIEALFVSRIESDFIKKHMGRYYH